MDIESQMASERLRKKLDDVNKAAQAHLAPVQDHINFTMQQAYFKCAYECFDKRRTQEEIARCADNCSVPIGNAQQHFENEMAKFQEKLNRSLMVCQDKFEEAKQHSVGSEAVKKLESCVERSIEENIMTLPNLVSRLKTTFSIRDEA